MGSLGPPHGAQHRLRRRRAAQLSAAPAPCAGGGDRWHPLRLSGHCRSGVAAGGAGDLRDPGSVSAALKIRWPLLALSFMFGLSALYSFAPSRARPHSRWLNWGAVIATLLWISASSAFSAYVSYVGSFDRFYGSLGGVAIFLFWLYLSGWAVILGAAIEGEIAAWHRGRRHSEIRRVLEERERHLASSRQD